jgi:eukaryotic-like serine/threonine-protein kinase
MTQARLLGGRYQVGELLGYGGMAEVHKGRDLRLGRDVAIKMLRTDLARDDTFQLRFRREAQNAASLNHPAIVAVYDTGEERGATGESLPYIVMEFVNGRTLKEVLAAEGRLMPRRALEITAEICAALDFSHRHGIIHRDIKPGNVMLTQNGQVKVMDFGIARALASGASTMTQTSAVIGTAQYLSPEQARGESVDARSDVYATGCVLYELLCGQPPFVGDSPVSVAYQHVREDAKAPSLMNRDVSPAIDAIVLKALAKNPLNRYQSAGEMRADLQRAVAGRPVYAEPVMAATGTATAAHRPTTGATRPVPARVGDSRRRRTSGWAIAALAALGVLAIAAIIAGLYASQLPSKETVPQLIGLTKDQATQQLSQANLAADPKATACTDTNQRNKVLQQDVTPGTKLNEGSTVTFSWCAGPARVQIPNVVGEQVSVAQPQLEALHLTVKVVQADSGLPQNQVISVSPAANSTVAEGQEVTLTVSKGNLRVIPDPGNLSPSQYEAVLADRGFTNVSEAQQDVNDPALDGKVVGVDPSPDPNKPRDPNTRITVFVGHFNQPTTPPPTSPSPSP